MFTTTRTVYQIKKLDSTAIMWFLIFIDLCLLGCFLLFNDSIFNFLFENNSTKTKADLLTIYMGVIGGGGVLYGFYINSKKLEEQNTQNKIAEQNKNDKRFADAIIFLKETNPGIILSAVNTLYQIALQDTFYRQTVAVLFCEYLNKDSQYSNDSRVHQTIVKYLLSSDLFNDIKLEINNASINFSSFENNISSKKYICFNRCSITNALLLNIDFLNIQNCDLKFCTISECSQLSMIYTDFYFSEIESIRKNISYANQQLKINL